MSFPSLPPENTDPWYAGLSASWAGLKTWVENLLAGKSDTGHAHTGAYDPAGTAAAGDAAHAGAADPHAGYQKESEKGQTPGYVGIQPDGKVHDIHLAGVNTAPTPPLNSAGDLIATTDYVNNEAAAVVANHAGAADPHAGYQKESEKGANSGYAPLDSSGKVPAANLPAGQAPTTDHGQLEGLGDDDHPQYLTAGRVTPGFDIAIVPDAGGIEIISETESTDTLYYAWSNATSGAVADGVMRANSLSPSTTTEIAVSERTADLTIVPGLIERMTVGHQLAVRDRTVGFAASTFSVTGAPVDQGSYWTIPVSFVGGNGSFPSNAKSTAVGWVHPGGTYGSAGGVGSGVSDHGLLSGLGDDDHAQYLTSARGDARYDSLGSATAGDAAHTGAADPHPQYANDDHVHAATGSTRKFNYDATPVGDPGAGRASIENTGGQARRFRVSKTDSAGTAFTLALLLPGDGLTVTDDPAAPPVTGFARYTITSDVTDSGTHWQFDGIRDDTSGSTAAPADGVSLRWLFSLASGGAPVSASAVTLAPLDGNLAGATTVQAFADMADNWNLVVVSVTEPVGVPNGTVWIQP